MAILCRFCVVWKYGNIAQFLLDKRVVFLTFTFNTVVSVSLPKQQKQKAWCKKIKRMKLELGVGWLQANQNLKKKVVLSIGRNCKFLKKLWGSKLLIFLISCLWLTWVLHVLFIFHLRLWNFWYVKKLPIEQLGKRSKLLKTTLTAGFGAWSFAPICHLGQVHWFGPILDTFRGVFLSFNMISFQ